jgi:hypothetical protein
MNWFFKWLRNKLNNIDMENFINSKERVLAARPSKNYIDDHFNSINFSVTRANGGYVVQFSQYDKRNDRTDTKLHIVTDDKDLGEEIGKIISFETLRS